MNRWIQFLIRCSKIYGSKPELVDLVNQADDPGKIFDEYYSEDEAAQINELNKQLKQRDAELNALEGQIDSLKNKLNKKTDLLSETKADNRRLKDIVQEKENVNPPHWLDRSDIRFTPRTWVVKSNGNLTEARLDLTDFFSTVPAMKDRVSNLITLDQEEKLMRIWDIVVDYTYTHDLKEDWRPAQVEYHYGKSDCEGLGSLFLSLARAAGVSPENLFLGLGHFKNVGHAFPVVYDEDQDDFLIYEATLNRTPNKPKTLSNSNYKIDWGLTNWRWSGSYEGTSTSTDAVGDHVEPEHPKESKKKHKEVLKTWNQD